MGISMYIVIKLLVSHLNLKATQTSIISFSIICSWKTYAYGYAYGGEITVLVMTETSYL